MIENGRTKSHKEEEKMSVCPKCNTANEDGAVFCVGCGSSMEEVQQITPDVEEVAAVEAAPVLEEVDIVEEAAPILEEIPLVEELAPVQKKKGGKKWLLFGGIGVVVAAAVAAGAIFLPKLFAGKQEKKEQVFYLKDNALIYYDLKKDEPLELTGKVMKDEDQAGRRESAMIQMSKDESRIFFYFRDCAFTLFPFFTLQINTFLLRNG